MNTGKDYIRSLFVLLLILAGAAALTYILVRTVQLQLHIIPEEQREAESYIQRTTQREKEKAARDHFHIIPQEPSSPVEAESACFLCHTTLPHHKHKKIRALLNMHTFYLACESCHVKKGEGQTIAYAWRDPEGADLSLGHYGTDYHPLSGSLLRVNLGSRIVPYVKRGGENDFLIQKTDSPMARDYVRMKDSLNEQEKDFVKKNFHTNINPTGQVCKECHRADGILNFKELGFSEKRKADLETLSVSGMMTRYETFYLPALFE
jgi:hypothetical protein